MEPQFFECLDNNICPACGHNSLWKSDLQSATVNYPGYRNVYRCHWCSWVWFNTGNKPK